MFKAKYFLGFLMVILSLSACHVPQKKSVLFNASVLTHSDSPQELVDIIGEKPDTAFHRFIIGKLRYIMMYNNLDSTEFRFAQNKLIEVIVHKPDYPFADSTITKFGFPFKPHTKADTTAFIMWDKGFKDMETVNFYKVGSRKDERTARYKIYFRLKQ